MGPAHLLLDMMEGYSKALYASFYLFRNFDLLLDCGEGCAARLDRHQFRARWIGITHYHHDHSGGLKGLFLARAYTKGSNDRPLTLFYPSGSPSMKRLRRWLEQELPRLPFSVEWVEVRPGHRRKINSEDARIPVELQAVEARHHTRERCVGYKIIETRTRLKHEYASLAGDQIAQLVRSEGKETLTESYTKNILVYSGDSAPLPVEEVRDTDLLLHDATFLSEKDREEPGHASVEQVLELATRSDVKGVVLVHISHRYSLRSVRKRVPQLARYTGYSGPIWVQWLDRLELLKDS